MEISLRLQATTNEINSIYCTYFVYTEAGNTPSHIGYCRINDIFNQRMPFPKNKPYAFMVFNTYKNGREAINAAHANGLPIINYKVGTRVRCIETGETFNNSADVIRLHKISQPALSNHLNGKRYYKTVKGKTYERF